MENKVTKLPSHLVVRLFNTSCVYCGVELSKDIQSTEHLIGRRFVPRGTLENCWNLILKCCKNCNGAKAELENDISALTMQPDAFGEYGHEDEAVKLDAIRKARRAHSRRTGKPVLYSEERTRATMRLGEVGTMTVELVSPPQVDHRRVFELARMQLVGFFYWITYQEKTRQGYWWPGEFRPLLHANRSDWGNTTLREFGDVVREWDVRVLGISAAGFFRVAIRKHPEIACWSWALEWNRSLRVVGFVEDIGSTSAVIDGIQAPKMKVLARTPEATLRFRREIPQDKQNDNLFS